MLWRGVLWFCTLNDWKFSAASKPFRLSEWRLLANFAFDKLVFIYHAAPFRFSHKGSIFISTSLRNRTNWIMHNAPDSNCMTDEGPSHLHFAMKLHSSERNCSLCGTSAKHFHISRVVLETEIQVFSSHDILPDKWKEELPKQLQI